MRRATSKKTVFWLLVLTIGAATWIHIQGSNPVALTTSSKDPKVAATMHALELARFDPPELNSYSEVVERPLFSQSRRPFVPPPVEPKVAKPEPSKQAVVQRKKPEPPKPVLRVSLLGIASTDETRIALLSNQDTGQQHQLRIGDTLLDWTLVEITEMSVSFRTGSEEKQLYLNYKTQQSQ